MLKQMIKPVLYSLGIILALSVMDSSVFAQLQPAISPWMGMMDRNRGSSTLGPYLSNVKPQQDMMKAYAGQQSQLQTQQQALQSLQGGRPGSGGVSLGGGGGPSGQDNKFILNPPREIPSAKSPAGFNQYLHYYPPGSLPRRPAPYFSPVR